MLPVERRIKSAYGLSERDTLVTMAALHRLLAKVMQMGIRLKVEGLVDVEYERGVVDNFKIGENKKHIRRALNSTENNLIENLNTYDPVKSSSKQTTENH